MIERAAPEFLPPPIPAPVPTETVVVPHTGATVTVQQWPPMAVSLLRAGVIGALLAGVDFFAALQMDYSVRDCAVSAGLIFFTNLAAGLGVGAMDGANSRRV